jgi:hypothetical protein
MRIQPASTIAVILFALLIATNAAYAAPPNSCDLFNPQAAATLFGGPLQPPMPVGTMCMYTNASGPVITLSVSPAPGPAGANFVRAKIGAGPGDTTESIPGLGDQNLFDARPNGWNVLTVFSHQKMLTFSVKKHLSPALKAAMIQAASQIIAKI